MSDLSKLSHEDALTKYANAYHSDLEDYEGKFDERKVKIRRDECLRRMSSTEPDWQPIETAPTHDWLDVWDKSVGLPFVLALRPTGFWIRLSYGAVPKDYAEENFTYWAPRPKGPTK